MAECEHCMEYLVLWHDKKTEHGNAARKIRKLKQIIRIQKEQLQGLKTLNKKQKKQLKKLNKLLDMQDALLTVFVHNWLRIRVNFHIFKPVLLLECSSEMDIQTLNERIEMLIRDKETYECECIRYLMRTVPLKCKR